VGVLAEMAVREPGALEGLVSRPAGHLFGINTTRVAFRRGVFLRHYVHALVSLLAPALTPDVIEAAMHQAVAATDSNTTP
jgi:LysR family cys regulon transcriptional activator